MTAQDRIQASIERIGAQRIAQVLNIGTKPMEDGAIAQTQPVGIAFQEKWLLEASDQMLDATLVHEIMHQAFAGPNKDRIRDLLGDLKVEPGMGSILLQDTLTAKTVDDFMQMTTNSLEGFDPTNSKTAFPTPESWEAVGKIIEKHQQDQAKQD